MKSMHRQDHILQSVLVCVSSPNLSLKWRRGAQKPAPQSHGASSGAGLTDPSRSAFSSLALIYIDISSLLLTGKHRVGSYKVKKRSADNSPKSNFVAQLSYFLISPQISLKFWLLFYYYI